MQHKRVYLRLVERKKRSQIALNSINAYMQDEIVSTLCFAR